MNFLGHHVITVTITSQKRIITVLLLCLGNFENLKFRLIRLLFGFVFGSSSKIFDALLTRVERCSIVSKIQLASWRLDRIKNKDNS